MWELPLSHYKTKVLRIGIDQPLSVYNLNGRPIDIVDHIRGLSFHTNNTVDFENHCDITVSNAKSQIKLDLLNYAVPRESLRSLRS